MYKIITKDLIIETDSIELVKDRINKLVSHNHKKLHDNMINNKISKLSKDTNFQKKISKAFFCFGSLKQLNRHVNNI